MNDETTTARNPREMTREELCEELTWTRQQLEAIYPYRCRDLSARQMDLRVELGRRELNPSIGEPA